MGRLWNWSFHPWWCRDSSSVWSPLVTRDDELVSEDCVKVLNILPTKSLEKLHCLCIKSVASLAAGTKFTVTLEIVLAHMELGAGGGEAAGAMQTVARVVMCTYLREQVRVVLQQQLEQLFLSQILKAVSLQNLNVVWSRQSMGIFTLIPKHAASAHEVPAQVKPVAALAPPALLLAGPQTGFGHDHAVGSQDLTPRGAPLAFFNGDGAVVEQDRAKYLIRNSETLRDPFLQLQEVQTAALVAQGPGDELGDDGCHAGRRSQCRGIMGNLEGDHQLELSHILHCSLSLSLSL